MKIVEGTTAPTSSLPFDVSEERRTFFLPFASSLALLQQLDSCAGSADNKQGKTPFVGAAFVAPTATVLGDVTIGAGSSVWYGATIRGDVHNIKIGANSSIGEGSMVHVAKIAGDHPTVIGDGVTVGANAVVHACTLESNSIVGAGATVLDGAKVQSNAVVAPGAMVLPGNVVGSGQLWQGSPAKHLRDLTEAEVASIPAAAEQTQAMGLLHAGECAKRYGAVVADLENAEDLLMRNPDFFPKVEKDGPDDGDVLDGGGVPGLMFNSKLKTTIQGKGEPSRP